MLNCKHLIMQYATVLILTLVTLSLASALTSKDESLLADIKQSAEQTKLVLMQQSLRNIIEMTDSIIVTNVVSARQWHQLQEYKRRALTKLAMTSLRDSDIEEALDELMQILGISELSEEEGLARLSRYTNGAYAIITEQNLQQANREIQIFAYITNPKIRQLSASAQQSEQRLISAFNNLAYAGLVRIEKSFSDFLALIESY